MLAMCQVERDSWLRVTSLTRTDSGVGRGSHLNEVSRSRGEANRETEAQRV